MSSIFKSFWRSSGLRLPKLISGCDSSSSCCVTERTIHLHRLLLDREACNHYCLFGCRGHIPCGRNCNLNQYVGVCLMPVFTDFKFGVFLTFADGFGTYWQLCVLQIQTTTVVQILCVNRVWPTTGSLHISESWPGSWPCSSAMLKRLCQRRSSRQRCLHRAVMDRTATAPAYMHRVTDQRSQNIVPFD